MDASDFQRLVGSGNNIADMLRLFQRQHISDSEEKVDLGKLPSAVHLLYASSKARIFTLADKLSCNQVRNDIQLVDASRVIEIPTAESWDFRLGDRVRIKYPMQDFKRIQSKTLGWSPRLRMIHSCDAVVVKCLSKYNNSIGIYTTSLLSVSEIYAGVLEKIPESVDGTDKSFSTRWHVNDWVIIEPRKKDKLVEILQRGLKKIPARYFGRRGRVVAITRVAVFVTFNERSCHQIHSALLTKCSNQSPLVIPARRHEDGFVLGQKVKVSENIKEVIENQKNHGGWAVDMTKIIGKQVTITHIRKNGDLFIQHDSGKSWSINSKSVTDLESSMLGGDDDDEIFRPKDVVKVKSHEHIRALMRKLEIPTDFLEYLRIPAKVVRLDDDFDYMITFNGEQNVQVLAVNLSVATSEERDRHNEIKRMAKEIAVGSSVVLDVGPLNYVHAILRDSSFDADVINVLTARSTLVGYTIDSKAVIESENGKRFRIGRKYLTVPNKFNM